jgi:hypothetical protein
MVPTIQKATMSQRNLRSKRAMAWNVAVLSPTGPAPEERACDFYIRA